MNLLNYINNVTPNRLPHSIVSLTELTSKQFLDYAQEKKKYELSLKPKPVKEPKVKKRKDAGKPRIKYDQTLPKKYLSYLKRANSKSIPMEVSVDRFEEICAMMCVYCNEPATGIDRIESSKGYIEGNMQSCCYRCNMMKHTATHEEFIKRVILIANNIINHLQ